MRIDGSRLLVTGGCGLIGSTTVERLLREHSPDLVILFDDLSRGTLTNVAAVLDDPRVRFIEGDVRDRDAVRRAMQGVDAVLHLAALRITACAADPALAVSVLCNGSYNVLEAARDAGVHRIVAASSASIYGLAGVFPTPETHPPYADRTLYGACKSFLEGVLRSFDEMYGLPFAAMRYFNVYGPRMDVHGRYTEVLVRWIERLAAGKPPLILGNGTQTMDFVYVEDVAEANVLALAADVSGEAFNVGSGVETSLRELAAALCAVMGCDAAPEYGPERSVNAVARRLADTGKAQRLLGFRARTPLDTGLRELVDWWLSNRTVAR